MKVLKILALSIARQFSLSEDQDHEEEISASIRRGVEFQGVNAWVLVFAILIASIGLNVNSTAVVIGAMLISPLMGPIMGIGLAIGIYDFELLKRSFVNLAFMVAVSLVTSILYFAVSPISMPSNEILARTTPTIWDVAIAFFGGLAGIIVGSSRQKGNAIPGVAIATALMPPLCTAGYGLATGKLEYFFGAFYLFFINAVMIGLATSLTVRFLNFHPVTQTDPKQQTRVKRLVYWVVVLTVLPSIRLGYRIVDKNIFENNLRTFIDQELNFANTQPILRQIELRPEKSATILLVGETVAQDTLDIALAKKEFYRLANVQLHIRQANNDGFESSLKDSIAHQQIATDKMLRIKDQHIKMLEQQLDSLRQMHPHEGTTQDVLQELQTLHSPILTLSLGELPVAKTKGQESWQWIAHIEHIGSLSNDTQTLLEKFIRQRLKKSSIRFVWSELPIKSTKNGKKK